MQKDSHINTGGESERCPRKCILVAPKDTFPIQVGAFKNKSNAEKISKELKISLILR